MPEAKRTVTDVYSWSYAELLAALGIQGEFTEIVINSQPIEKAQGRVTIITKTDGVIA